MQGQRPFITKTAFIAKMSVTFVKQHQNVKNLFFCSFHFTAWEYKSRIRLLNILILRMACFTIFMSYSACFFPNFRPCSLHVVVVELPSLCKQDTQVSVLLHKRDIGGGGEWNFFHCLFMNHKVDLKRRGILFLKTSEKFIQLVSDFHATSTQESAHVFQDWVLQRLPC